MPCGATMAGSRMHGLLNVLVATHEALDGAGPAHVARTLERDATPSISSDA